MVWLFLLLCLIALAFAVRAYIVMCSAEAYREKWRRRMEGLPDVPPPAVKEEAVTTGELRRRFDAEGKFR